MPAQVPAGLSHQTDVVLNAELAKNRGFLRQVGESLLGTDVHRQFRDILPIEENGALLGFQKAYDHVEGGGLTRSVGAE